MTLKQAYIKLARAAREIAKDLRKARKFKYGTGNCILNGAPCCVFGEVLKRAGLLNHMSPSWVVGNSTALERAVWQFQYPYKVPEPIAAALDHVGNVNDNELMAKEQPKNHRRLLADALDQFASVVKATMLIRLTHQRNY